MKSIAVARGAGTEILTLPDEAAVLE